MAARPSARAGAHSQPATVPTGDGHQQRVPRSLFWAPLAARHRTAVTAQNECLFVSRGSALLLGCGLRTALRWPGS